MAKNYRSLFVLSPILRDRKLALAISGMALLQLTLAAFGMGAWQCPFIHVLGIPCPGCGLTRASLFLFRGDWRRAIDFHAFAPVFIIALALVICAAIAPKSPRARLLAGIESLERHTGITSLVLLGLIVYWLARVLILQSAFVRLIQG
jgi:hypothetical protein